MREGNLKRSAALGESCIKWFSDRGSIPLASTKKPRGTHWVPLGFFVAAAVIEPCEFCVLATCGETICCGRKTSATFSRFCGAKQRLSKPLRGNSTDFAAGECPRFPSPTQQAPPRHKTDKLPLTLQQKCSTMQWHRGVAQLVARLLWDCEIGNSSKIPATSKKPLILRFFRFHII